MALPVTITGLATAFAPVGPFKSSASFLTVAQQPSPFAFGGISANAVDSGQTFTTTSAANLNALLAYVLTVGAPTDSVVANIYATSGGFPTGNSLGTSSPILASALSGTASAQTFTFSSQIALSASTVYAFVLSRTGAGNETNRYAFTTSTSTSVYAGGNVIYRTSGSWTPSSAQDAGFTLFGDPAFYIIGRDSSDATMLRAYKATDPTSSWSSVATFIGAANSKITLASSQAGSTIHLIMANWPGAGTVGYSYTTFNMATDTFGSQEQILAPVNTVGGTGTDQSGCGIVVRSTGEAVAFFNGLQTKTSGSFYSRAYYSRRTAPNTWSAAVQVDSNTAGDSLARDVSLGLSDRLHFFWQFAAGNVHRALTSANVLQTVSASFAGTSARIGSGSYTKGAVVKVRAGTIQGATSFAQLYGFDSADVPTVSALGSTTPSGSSCSPARLFYDSPDLWMVSCTATAVRTHKSSDDGVTIGNVVATAMTGTFNTGSNETLSRDALVYQRGNAIVAPYVVNDNGTLKYNEYVVRFIPITDAWSAADKTTSVTLSNADKTAASASPGQGVRSTTARLNTTAGKYYVEFVTGNVTLQNVGLRLGSEAIASAATQTANVNLDTGAINVGATNVGSVGSKVDTGAILCLAWDSGAERIWFRKNNGLWNNDAAANPATGVNGIDVSSFTDSVTFNLWAYGGSIGGMSSTVRTELADLSYTSGLSGFTTWMNEALPLGPPADVCVASPYVDSPPTIGQGSLFNTPWQPVQTTFAAGASLSLSVTENAASGVSHFAQRTNISLVAGARNTFSVTYKPIGPTPRGVALALGSSGVLAATYFNANGTYANQGAGGAWTIQSHQEQDLGGGIYKAIMVCTGPDTTSAGTAQVYLYNSGIGGITYAGLNDGSGVEFDYTLAVQFTVSTAGLATSSPTLGVPVFSAIVPLVAVALAVAAPVIDTAVFAQVHKLPIATPLAVPSPTISSAAFKQIHALPIAITPVVPAPTLAAGTFAQVHVIGATPLAVTSLALDAPTIALTVPMVASSIAVSIPTVGVSTFQQRHAMQANALAVQPPVCGAAAITIPAIVLAANNLSATAPALGSPALQPTVLLSASNLATAPPLEAAAAFSQVQAFTAIALASSPPTFAVPAFNKIVAAVASPLAVGLPTLSAPALGQAYALVAIPLATSSPAIGAGIYSGTSVVVALPLTVANLSLGQGTFAQKQVLTATAPVLSPPAIAAATFTQNSQTYGLIATALATASPTLGLGTLGQTGVMSALPLVVANPSLGQGVLAQTQILAASPLAGSPFTFSAVSPKQAHAFTATTLAISNPAISLGLIAQAHSLTTAGLTTTPTTLPLAVLGQSGVMGCLPIVVASPVIGAPAFGQTHLTVAQSLVTSAPALGVPALGKVLAAAALVVSPPVIGSPSVTKVLAATPLAIGAVALGTPVVALRVFGLTPLGLTIGSPVIPAISIGQSGVMGCVPLTAGNPILGAPVLEQQHVLVPTGATVGPPALDAPAFGRRLSLVASAVASGAPALGQASVRQAHTLASAAAISGRPVLGAAFLGQAGVMAVVPLTVQSPTLPAPALRSISGFTGNNLAVGSPVIAASFLGRSVALPRPYNLFAGRFRPDPATLGQVHALNAPTASAGAPVIAPATMFERESFAEPPLVVGSPVLGTSTLVPVYRIIVAASVGPHPVLAQGNLGQQHRFAARDLVVSRPTFYRPRLGLPAVALPDAVDLIIEAPVLDIARLYREATGVEITGRRPRLTVITGQRNGTVTLTTKAQPVAPITGQRNGKVTITGRRPRMVM